MLTVQFLSTGTCLPTGPEDETASLLINGRVLVDTGWHCVRNLLAAGILPDTLTALCFTHMHQDHYIALPQLLFYLYNKRCAVDSLTIYGPQRVREVVETAYLFMGKHRPSYVHMPEIRVVEMQPGEGFEAAGLRVGTCASVHTVPGLCYRFWDPQSDRTLVFTGDTAPHDEINAFAAGCDALIHEQARGPARPSEEPNSHLHSTAEDAARCARGAGAKALYLVHASPETREESLERAGRIFQPCHRPTSGDRVTLG